MIIFPQKYLGRIYGGYEITTFLGQGRYGACFMANGPEKEAVVLKRFHKRIKEKNKEKNYFEPVILSSLNHPAIPSLLGVINEKGEYFFVLEYMPGATIEKLLFQQQYVFCKREIYDIGMQLTDILCYLHQSGVVHRDIRISNVLYLKNKQISLIDFGLSRFLSNEYYAQESDFSYLGDFLLYLFYSGSSKGSSWRKKVPWYEELPLPQDQITFLKRLLGLQTPYDSIATIRKDFSILFCENEKIL